MKNQLSILFILGLFSSSIIAHTQTPNLRTAANFLLFTTTGQVGNTGVSVIAGKVGTNNGAIVGFTAPEENANSVTALAATDLQTAYDEIRLAPQTFPTHAAILGNDEILKAGVYLIAEAGSIEGNLTLDAEGNSNSIFIIKIEGAFSPGPSSKIILANGALSCNVYWAVEGGAIAIAALSEMKGSFIANPGAVSMAAGSKLQGRLLSTTGAIAVDAVVAGYPVCGILSVNLIDFDANRTNNIVNLTWAIKNEFLFAGYDLERSSDAVRFSKIGSVNSTNNPETKIYKWTDQSPLRSTNYYRLKLIEKNGTFKYSKILSVYMAVDKSISIYPNPVVGHTLTLQMYGQKKGEHMLNIYSANGRQVMNTMMTLENDGVRTIPLKKNLATGFYFLQITDPSNNMETRSFYIQ